MKKYKKTYAILHLAEKRTTFHLGKTKVHVSFTGGQVTKKGVTPATFTTDDPIVQLAIEKSKDFESGAVTLLSKYPVRGEVKIGMNPPETVETEALNAIMPETEQRAAAIAPETTVTDTAEKNPEPNPEPQIEEAAQDEVEAETEKNPEEVDTNNLETVEVSCKDVAKQYLEEHYGENPTPLRTIKDVQECAAKYGIRFDFV